MGNLLANRQKQPFLPTHLILLKGGWMIKIEKSSSGNGGLKRPFASYYPPICHQLASNYPDRMSFFILLALLNLPATHQILTLTREKNKKR